MFDRKVAVGALVGAILSVAVWFTLNVGMSLYKDLQFLHAARVYTETHQVAPVK